MGCATFIVALAEALHPLTVFVAVTVYVVVLVGETLMLAPVSPPGIQVKLFAVGELAVKVVVAPEQAKLLVGETLTLTPSN
jgi:hypothetical protein